VTQPSTVHPDWCSPQHCELTDPNLPTDGGFHRSDPIAVNLDLLISPHGRVGAVTAWLQQAACPWPTVVFLHVAFGPDSELFLPLPQAADALSRLADLQTAVH